MLKVKSSGQFRKDYKKCEKRDLNMNILKEVVAKLAVPERLEPRNKDHELRGNYTGFRECHIMSDWLLIYRYADGGLELARTGTHSDLFRN